jgi:regulator of sigma E protease
MVRDGVAITHLLTAQVNPAFGFKLLNLDPKDHPVIDSLTSGGAAEAAGLRVGDQFISFGGVPIVGQSQLVELIRSRPGAESPVEISRGSERLKLQVTPRLDPDAKVGRIGVALSPSRVLVYQLQRPGPTPWEQVNGVLEQMGDVISALSHSKETGITPKDMSGPVGIFGKLAADANVDIRLALGFIVMVNINLALLNLLPLPVLDGGHIVFSLIELLTFRRIPARVYETATLMFGFLLLSFMAFVFYNDVRGLSVFRSILKQENVIQAPATNGPSSAQERPPVSPSTNR